MIERTDREPRYYELSTVKGTAGLLIQTIIPGLGLLWAFLDIEEDGVTTWNAGVFIFCLLALALIVGPAWIYTIARMLNAFDRERAEISTITEKAHLRRIELQIEEIRTRSLAQISGMNRLQLDFALALQNRDIFRIDGQRVSWFVEGLAIPPDFALDWLEKYHKRQVQDSSTLPAKHDWNRDEGIFTRELSRQYNDAIIKALANLGAVKLPGGPFPPRWIIEDTTSRNGYLAQVGLWIAASWAETVLEQASEDIRPRREFEEDGPTTDEEESEEE